MIPPWRTAEQPSPATQGVTLELGELIRLQADARQLTLRDRGHTSRRSGGHLSPFRGRGIDFDQVRAYQDGDDIRCIDWRVTARTGRPHTKVFHEERERPVWLAVDLGQTMRFGSRVAFKSIVAARAAALLAWMALEQGDRVGGVLRAGAREIVFPPCAGRRGVSHLFQAMRELHSLRPEPETSSPLPGQLARLVRPGSLICLCGDLYHDTPESLLPLAGLTRHNTVLVVAIHDPLEELLPTSGHYTFSDGQRRLELHASKRGAQEHQQRFQARQSALRTFCQGAGMQWITLSTADNLVPRLSEQLRLR